MSDAETQERLDELENRIDRLEQLHAESEKALSDETIRDIEATDGELERGETISQEEMKRRLGLDEEEPPLRTVIRDAIDSFEEAIDSPAPTDIIAKDVAAEGYDIADVRHEMDLLLREGEIYKPDSDTVKVV